jgi:general secretion pathway protein I
MTQLRRRRPRRGLSLLEVVVSMAILLMSAVALSQLVTFGSARALDAQQQATGTMLAQRKLAEVMIGAVPASSSGFAPFDDDGMPNWQWKLDVNSNSVAGVYNVQVTIKYDSPDGSSDLQVELGQMMFDPTQRGSSLDAPPVQDGDPNAGQNNNSNSNSATGSASPQSGNATAGGMGMGKGKTGANKAGGGAAPGGTGKGGTNNNNKTGTKTGGGKGG